jgi:hypothetical protein
MLIHYSVELATSNPGKSEQGLKASRDVIELTSRVNREYDSYFNEEAIKHALTEKLKIPLTQPIKYALAISQLKLTQHSQELFIREQNKAINTILMVTDSIAVCNDEQGKPMAVNRDDVSTDPIQRERVRKLVNSEGHLKYHAFTSFTMPGDKTIYTVPTFLEARFSGELAPEQFPVAPKDIPKIANSYRAGYLQLDENNIDSDFSSTQVLRTETVNWDGDAADRSEPARQYMGGTTYDIMRLIKHMSGLTVPERSVFDGALADGTHVPFVRIQKQAYSEITQTLPLPQPKAR